MLDKELVKSKFQKSILTYSDYAVIQLEMAKKLARYIKGNYENVLEIGSYSGFLTREVIKNIEFKSYCALDIVDSFNFIKNLSPKIKFILGDIEQINLEEKYDLIISSSSLQWCDDFCFVIKKLKSYLKQNGHIMIAVFGEDNLYQIKNTFNVSLNYPKTEDIKKLFSNKSKIIEDKKTIKFDSSKDILRHLKYTGVNAFKTNYTYSQIKEKLNILENKFNNELTYHPVYIID